jgi:leucyl aminopeptidase
MDTHAPGEVALPNFCKLPGINMELTCSSLKIETRRTGCAVIAVHQGRRLDDDGKRADAACEKHLSQVLRRGDMNGKIGETLLVHAGSGGAADRILLVGAGPLKGISAAQYRKLASSAAGAIRKLNTKDACVYLQHVNVLEHDYAWKARTLGGAIADSTYAYSATRQTTPHRHAKAIHFASPKGSETKAIQAALSEASAVSGGIATAKELGNLPGNICTPTYLAAQARALGKSETSIKVKVLNEAEMKKLGMNTLLSVSAGSEQPAKLITMEYNGGAADRRPVVLVGKGVTFDTGGISLKPGGSMDEMKFDMCGAASVFGTMQAVARMGLAVNLVGIVAATENMPSGTATKPGDVITSMSGQTVEILNTDAEGRLILCDALTYAERFDPDVIVDIATLTGACVVALGNVPTGVFSNHDPLAHALLEAGEYTGDRGWQMPVWDEFQDQLKSNFADMANIGGRAGGAITAACFLSRFVRQQRWAHLDIAGTAWHSGGNKGSTGRPVPLLTEFVKRHKPRRKQAKR